MSKITENKFALLDLSETTNSITNIHNELNNKKNSDETYYHENGSIKNISSYKDGKLLSNVIYNEDNTNIKIQDENNNIVYEYITNGDEIVENIDIKKPFILKCKLINGKLEGENIMPYLTTNDIISCKNNNDISNFVKLINENNIQIFNNNKKMILFDGVNTNNHKLILNIVKISHDYNLNLEYLKCNFKKHIIDGECLKIIYKNNVENFIEKHKYKNGILTNEKWTYKNNIFYGKVYTHTIYDPETKEHKTYISKTSDYNNEILIIHKFLLDTEYETHYYCNIFEKDNYENNDNGELKDFEILDTYISILLKSYNNCKNATQNISYTEKLYFKNFNVIINKNKKNINFFDVKMYNKTSNDNNEELKSLISHDEYRCGKLYNQIYPKKKSKFFGLF